MISLYKAVAGSQRGLNVLGLIMFCFVFGGILAKMDKEAEILIKIIEVINEASVKMIKLVMMFVTKFILLRIFFNFYLLKILANRHFFLDSWNYS